MVLFLVGCTTTKNLSIEEPAHKKNEQYVKHLAYSLVYDESIEQARWVSYQLSDFELTPNYERTNKFIEDDLVVTKTANNNDYKKSGFDRGHLAPAADMTWDKQAMDESFYYSNISPQLPGFNRGIWKNLESDVRQWAKKYKTVLITTGPICGSTDEVIGENKVIVPTKFFKTIVIYSNSVKQGIGFIFPHEKIKGDIFDYAVSIDEVEKETGINLYPALPNKIEKQIEDEVDLSYWK